MALLNEPQSRAILCGLLDIHQRMTELEALIASGTRPSPFSKYVNDLSPTEAKVVHDYFARIRTAMLGHLRECEIPLDVRPTSLRWALQCGITFIGITVDELRPEALRGYGALDETGYAQVAKIRDDLERLVDQVAAYLRQGLGRDLTDRLSRLEAAHVGVETLSLLEKVVTRWQLVEFRPVLEMIISRLEAPSFEVAVFGRVSSGKSSLLNHIAGKDALPVGVTPVTAVPTRLASGDKPTAVVSFAESESRAVALEHLWEYASEEGNPGNRKHVTSILVKLPSPRLREGVIFVDTPGVGSLALSGGAEALAYLPRCDLGVVLVDAASALNEEDLALLRALYEAGIPAMVLLSKADLLAPRDRERMTGYIREQFRRELGLDLPVHPVSIVGADESLLTGWYDQELTPLLDRHRSLTEASLRRKIAHVRESVIAVLETLLTRRRGGEPEDHAQVDSAAARLLEGADEAIRQARGRSLD
jgi:GTP-binding protein EngB required for normal cell division